MTAVFSDTAVDNIVGLSIQRNVILCAELIIYDIVILVCLLSYTYPLFIMLSQSAKKRRIHDEKCYKANADECKEATSEAYESNPKKKKEASRKAYNANSK